MKHRFLFILILAVAALLASCAGTKAVSPQTAPRWASADTVGEVYPPTAYIARLGYGTSADSARTAAEAELGAYFERTVQSSTSATQTMKSGTGGATTDEREIRRSVLVTSNVRLFAVNFTEPWHDEARGDYSVCAYIDRAEAWNVFSPKVVQAQKAFRAQYDAADDEPDALKKLVRLRRAQPLAEDYADLLDFAHALSPERAAPYEADRGRIAAVDEAMLAARLEATMRVTVTGDLENRIKRKVSSLLAAQNFVLAERGFAYSVAVTVERNKVVRSSDDNIITAEPGITVAVTNGSENIATYAKTFKRISGFSDEFIDKKIFDALEKELDKSFADELQAAIE